MRSDEPFVRDGNMSLDLFRIGFLVVFGLVTVFIIVASVLVMTHVWKTFRHVDRIHDQVTKSMAASGPERDKLRPTTTSDVLRCKQCGAVVDSTAELSPEGRIRCNYCNTWTSLYSPGTSTKD